MEEVKGIADALEIPRDVAITLNFVYELATFCTSAIGKLNNGTIIHVRNLDYAFPEMMKKVTFEAHYVKNG